MFGGEFEDIREISKSKKSPIFFTPHEAALAIRLLIDRMIILKKIINISND